MNIYKALRVRPVWLRIVGVMLLAAGGLTGCYTYVPTQDIPPQGRKVRIALSQPQDVRLSDITANDVVDVQGEVAAVDSSVVILSAYTLRSQSGYENLGKGESMQILRDNISSIRQSRIAPLNTAGLVAIGLLIGIVTGVALADAGNAGEGGGGGGRSQ